MEVATSIIWPVTCYRLCVGVKDGRVRRGMNTQHKQKTHIFEDFDLFLHDLLEQLDFVVLLLESQNEG